MAARVVHRSEVAGASPGALPLPAAVLADLGFPCHLDCVQCRRQRPPSPREYGVVLRTLTEAATEPDRERLRVVFHGGDIFTQPREFERLLRVVGEACRPGQVAFDAAVISDGVAWEPELIARFFELGVRHYQVCFDGPPALHDVLRPLHGTGCSFGHVLRSVQHRGAAEVIARVDPGIAPESLRELLLLLDEAHLFVGDNPVTIFVAPAGPYPREARELVQVLEFLHSRPRPEESTAMGTLTQGADESP